MENRYVDYDKANRFLFFQLLYDYDNRHMLINQGNNEHGGEMCLLGTIQRSTRNEIYSILLFYICEKNL